MANNSNESKTYKQQAGEYYNKHYDNWMPWIEDKYLSWFTKDNKASYATKRTSPLIMPSPHLLDHQLSSIPSLSSIYTIYTPSNPPPENLDKSKVTGIEQVDKLQDGVNGLVSGQVGKGGLAQPLGDAVSKEGINRAERGGKDESGKPIEGQGPLGGYGQSATDGVKSGAGSVSGGVKGAGGYLGGMVGGNGEGKK
jgi:hypothetical protein